ncbi:MAG: HAD family hydrolase [Candidatus Eremiobacteraeota bacterium]|nr:HAD family hydrolase [Candidatus Eremiobacteraeota bacterium]
MAAVLFDLDDTLHDDTATYRRAAERVAVEIGAERGLSAERLLAAYIEHVEAFWKNLVAEDLAKSLVGVRAAMWRAALEEAGDSPDGDLATRAADTYNRYRKEHLRLWPGALELLSYLREHGIRLGLLTNGFAETHREKIVLLQLEDAFDEVFIADEMGMLKPDPRLFRAACERLGAPPFAAAMVGDRYNRDVRGAHDIGMFTVWLNVRRESVPEGQPPPDAIVHTLAEVRGALAPALKR